MVRSFIVLLLLAVFFLAGTLYGMDRESVDAMDEKIGSIEVPSNNPESNNYNNERIVNKEKAEGINEMEMKEPNHFTEKAASFLEAGVKGFYEVIVQILYQVSQLFF